MMNKIITQYKIVTYNTIMRNTKIHENKSNNRYLYDTKQIKKKMKCKFD